MKIHFICRGNVLRSLVAETYVKSLGLEGISCISSGVNVDLNDPTERSYFKNTLALLARHRIVGYAKSTSDQLTQERVDDCDVTICVNERAFNEASAIVTLPENTITWDIVDIGEGMRAVDKDIPNIRISYEDEIYQEITALVDKLVDMLESS